MKSKSVLVTGAGGFIGSHLAETLVRSGARVKAMVRYNALRSAGWLDRSDLANDMEIVYGDITDPDSVDDAVKGVDVVFHLAALIAIPYSYVAPRAYVEANINGTVNVLQAALRHGSTVLQTSTSEVYGTARIAPIPLTHPLQGQSPYSATKIASDKLAESFHRSFELPVVIVRPFNTFGPRQSDRAVIPTVIKQVLAGDTVRIGATSPTRDFNFVENTVDAFIKVSGRSDLFGETLHFGSGREISIGDLVALIARLEGKTVEVVGESERLRPAASEVERLIADNTEVARLLPEWRPSIDLEEGLRRTIAWFRESGSLANAGRYIR
jgi:NAD dependent epimerase/dehydratase